MIDIKLIREQPAFVKENARRRQSQGKPNYVQFVEDTLAADEKWRGVKQQVDELRHRRNILSEEINKMRKAGGDVTALLKEAKELPILLMQKEGLLVSLQAKISALLYLIPNLLDASVPLGKDAQDNPVLRKWGELPQPSFELKNHVELAESFTVADFDAGRKVAGQGFNYIIGKLAMLDVALQRYGIDFLLKKGFTVVVPPLMLNKATLSGAVDLSAFAEVIYKVENEDLYLIGTAEHSLVSMLSDKILNQKQLPLKLCAVTPCFRKEIGAHGVDTKGLFRMHQFNKVEQVVAVKPEESRAMLESMQKLTEKFFQSLKIPYRVIEICSGDLGGKFAKQYDIEAYFPRQRDYREVTSAGNCTDFQARRLNVRYEEKGERKYVHLLNNTMVATSRAMVAILENFQEADGTVSVPRVLWKYTGFRKIDSL